MQAREFLKSLKKKNDKIQCLKLKLETLETRAIGISSIDYSRDLVQTSPSGVPAIDSVISEITETRARIKELEKNFEEQKCKTLVCICRVENQKYVKLLTMRYLDFLSFGKIAEQMFYSEQSVKNMHYEAIKNFEKANESVLFE